ncbi:MAG: NADH dehydrogenase subunit B [Candidatus Methanohalarchaeum thermophilum]|uniref:NADH dehydrogenase subunit B n=1 Tax=Methanohalarchaeum thermophilum TaxID=1903181 RepID=A0A1Q6DXD7_METT1|nr:MAG: NADH dehydrogenase subunit B [Candidatus Methanohalarchaeum thermophilum]
MGIIVGKVEKLFKEISNWGRKNSLWAAIQPIGCCGMEMLATSTPHYDADRWGVLYFESVRRCDLIIVGGYITKKYLPRLKYVYDQMTDPTYVLAMGECAISGGPFYDSYAMVTDVDEHIPIDVHIPGCPPRPEALLDGIRELQEKIQEEGDLEGKLPEEKVEWRYEYSGEQED